MQQKGLLVDSAKLH